MEDLCFTRKGLSIYCPWSKTDQMAEGRTVAVPRGENEFTCPVIALEEWLAVRGRHPGAVFVQIRRSGAVTEQQLRAAAVNVIVKSALGSIGVRGQRYGSHSLRAGCITAAGEAGATETAIMQRTGHKSIEMVILYTRPARAFASDPLAGVL